ncbi:GDP-fucose protein O-fucosyltransferase [Musa troglodytarum]|uniref:O-fucosyltransferase family protein n=1 Tax=Musa troglodytarum TaxID=320322 RepID=A0A9E7I9C5_9LILI|nr:GDP-fucose protein O-fucosyltransferase [Musa troglodytarum]
MRGRSWPVNVGGGGAGKGGTSPIVGRVVHGAAAAALRWRVALLLVPLVYVALMLVFVGWWNLEAVPVRVGVPVLKRAPPPGSVYRSPQVFQKLWPFMQSEFNHSNACVKLMMAWHQKTTQKWKPCLRKRSLQAELSPSNGFLIIEANGGLNQQRLSISDAVAVAGILNATLVIPIFHFNSVWCDSRAVRIAPFSYRLAHSVPSSIQRLRCLTNYEALRFSPPIRTLAERMIDRMVKNSSSNGGKYISVHLRFEKDMVAFSCCTYDGGQQEKTEMDKARERGWRGKFNKPGRVIRPEANRRNGKCPLTPLEVGMMLRGMGFGNTTTIYVASGKIYNAQKYMAPLHQLFPLLETKETLASADELAPFKGHSSRLAALDYTVCAHSEVFVTTQGGNFPHFLMGHRRYFNGHSKTIKPDKRKLVLSFDNPNIRWDRFKHHMQEIFRHSDLKGVGLRKPGSC